MYYLLSFVVMGVGALMILRPETWFRLTEGWKSDASYPSDSYTFHTRFGGVMCILAGAAYIVINLLGI